MTINTRRIRYIAAALAAVLVAAGAYAFTASNTVPSSNAGSGSGTISGYTVSNIAYQLNAADPTTLDSISFTLDKTAGTVKAQLKSGGSWFSCTNSSGNNWSCTTTGADVASATNLSVVATD